jgi:hypothetical protein
VGIGDNDRSRSDRVYTCTAVVICCQCSGDSNGSGCARVKWSVASGFVFRPLGVCGYSSLIKFKDDENNKSYRKKKKGNREEKNRGRRREEIQGK